jgi:hypothetical protein
MQLVRAYDFKEIDPKTGFAQFEQTNKTTGVTTSTIYPNADSRLYVDRQVKAYGGFSSSLAYKGIRLEGFFNFQNKPVEWGYLHYYSSPLGTIYNLPTKFATDFWTPEHVNATRPGLTSSSSGRSEPDETGAKRTLYTNISRYHESNGVFSDASYLRLKTVILSYTLPRTWTNSLKMDEVMVYVLGNNLFTVTNYDGFDPETLDAVPPAKTFKCGIRLSF